ncbi:MAG: Uma2 family endonuclease [Cyanobacteria bacterium P01_D01_bin.123]
MRLSAMNPTLRFERNADGSLVTMPPTGGISGNREAKAILRLGMWVEANDAGEFFSSSTGFKLPNGAVRSPDAAFVAKDRLPENWDSSEDSFITVVPDLAIEIRSKTDSLATLQAKMQEYIANGVCLGWLIDRPHQRAFVYRADGSVTQYPATATLYGEAIAPGFQLKLQLLL